MTSGTPWRNWARTESALPARTVHPRDAGEVAAAVRGAGDLRVRAAGGGHSFTGAAVTDGVHLFLGALSHVESVVAGPDGRTHVTVGAGIGLGRLNAELAARGLGMENLGDIDHQTLAGAVSTGTHGTGARMRGLAAQIVGVRLVTADGRVVDADAGHQPGLFELGRLGLGTAGVLVALTLAAVPAFRLEAREEPWPLDAVLERLDGPDGLVEGNDHFEFYWFPHTRRTLTKRNNRAPDDLHLPLHRARAWVDDELLSNAMFAATNRTAALLPRLTPRINGLAAQALSARRYTAASHEVFVSRRRVRFREMEYAIPRDALPHVLARIDAWIEASGEHLPFPVEVRFAAPDDLWLSTAHARASAYVAVHQYARLPHRRYFRAVERIMAEVDGRPHWGKLHTLGVDRLAELYPRLGDAQRVRREADPTGRFSNDYVDRVLGPIG